MAKITIVAGARPNFMKIAPIIEAIENQKKEGYDIDYRLVHTGQHYDKMLSDTFFEQLNIPYPHANLEVGSGTQAEQTAGIMVKFEQELLAHPTDLVVVVGDVTSTMACSIVAKKLLTKVAHVEAGIRSFDLSMPEEINRMVTDAITDYFFTTSEIANENLKKAGIEENRIFFVGNTMIDTLLKNISRVEKPAVYDELQLTEGEYFVLTLHRPANVDEENKLTALMNEIVESSQGLPIIFPAHPRTAKIISAITVDYPNLHIISPLGYLEFIYLVKNAKAVITDSGGIQEETTVLGIPCLTLRDNTERPETIHIGSNELIGTDPQNIKPAMQRLFQGLWKKSEIPHLWDGSTAHRIIRELNKLLAIELSQVQSK